MDKTSSRKCQGQEGNGARGETSLEGHHKGCGARKSRAVMPTEAEKPKNTRAEKSLQESTVGRATFMDSGSQAAVGSGRNGK